jgi:hypothetical protein
MFRGDAGSLGTIEFSARLPSNALRDVPFND